MKSNEQVGPSVTASSGSAWRVLCAHLVGHCAVWCLSLAAVTVPFAPVHAANWGADYFPAVTLTTHEGRKVQLWDDLLKDRKVAVAVMYTSCSTECPLITARMVELKKALGGRVGKDIFFYSISIDPWDRPEVLKDYAAKFGAGGAGWEFLTGDPEDIKLVTKKLGLSRLSDRDNKDGHTASLMIGNVATGQWMRHSAVDNPAFLAASMLTFLGLNDGRNGPSYADFKPVTVDPGAVLFQSRCSGCHTLGKGDKIGPDLMGLTARRPRQWVARYIVEPQALRAAGDPAALELMRRYPVRMPSHSLTADDLATLLAHLERASTPAPGSVAQTGPMPPR